MKARKVVNWQGAGAKPSIQKCPIFPKRSKDIHWSGTRARLWLGVKLLSGYCVIEVVFCPCNKERTAVMQLTEPREIVIAPVEAIDAVRHNRESGFCDGQFVAFSVGDDKERGAVAVMIERAMQFERAFARAEFCPRGQGQAQFYDRGVNAVELILETEAVLWRERHAVAQQRIEQAFEDAAGTGGIGVGERGFGDRLLKAEMVKLGRMSAKAALYGSEAVIAAGLRVEEDDKLLPRAEMLDVAVTAYSGNRVFEIMSLQEI